MALALALANGDTIAEAATSCGVSERTVSRRKEDPEFASFVRQLRAQMREQACGRASRAARKAVVKLEELLDSTDERVALGAGRALLEHGPKLAETVDIDERLRLLEARLKEAEAEGLL